MSDTDTEREHTGGVWISTNRMYEEVRETRDAVLKLIEAVRDLREDVAAAAALEKRITALEARMAGWQGPTGVIGGLAGLGAAIYAAMNGGGGGG